MSHAGLPVVAVLCATHRPSGIAGLERRAEVRYVTKDTLADGLRGADVLFVWDFMSTALKGAWASADNLNWVHIAAAGVDRLMFPELIESSVTVTNSRGVLDRPMAEYVLGMILMFAKDLHATWRLQERREWRHRETERIEGKQVLIVGVGSVGREVSRLLAAAGMRITGIGRTARSGDPDFGVVHADADIAGHVNAADFVVVTAPLTERTRGMIDAEFLARMKRTARLINVGRGAIVDEEALLAALRAQQIAGAAMDVFDTEPLPRENTLWNEPNMFVSPHMSADSIGWLDMLAQLFVANFDSWVKGRPLRNEVDKRLSTAIPRIEEA